MASTIPPEFTAAIGGHPIVADILWRRGFTTVETALAFLYPDRYTPFPAEQMPGMAEAVERLRAAIANSERIRVWGDFDADGQTSTSLLVLGLRALGATVDFNIPNRATHSHGLNKHGIAQAKEDAVRVLVTCDCGVTDFEEIAFAQELGLDVIVTDHHDLADALPDSCAVINPKRLPADHPVAHLPGVGVAYKLIEALAGEQGSVEAEAPLFPRTPAPSHPCSPASLLDLVALGIVADVAEQRGDARYLLQRGLACLRANPRPGVRALLRVANIEPSDLSADSIGYQIGPRLNAVGRLDNAALSVELLTTNDQARADKLAARIEELNQERKVVQRAVEEEAFRQIAQDHAMQRRAAIVLTSPSWHPSVLGVVASSVSNRYGKPAILISVRPGEVGRGSARSVRGLDIHAAITAQTELVETSGGHPMAAGFAIRSENVAAFREGIQQYISAHAPAAATTVEGEPEVVLSWRDVTLQLCEDLERLAPFGPGNRRPMLKSEGLRYVRTEPLGNDGKHQAVFFQDESGYVNKALWWRSSGQWLPDTCDLVYTLHYDSYHGKPRMQVQVVRVEPVGQADAGRANSTHYKTGGRFRSMDRREAQDRKAELQRLLDQFGADNVQVWYEGAEAADGWPCATLNRLELEPKPVLVILSAPPGSDELAAALKRAMPQTVVLLTPPVQADNDRPGTVVPQLLNLLKVSEQQGEPPDDASVIARIAAQTGQREATVRACADYHCAHKAQDKPGMDKAMNRLVYFLEETRGMRRYFQEVSVEAALRLPG